MLFYQSFYALSYHVAIYLVDIQFLQQNEHPKSPLIVVWHLKC